MGCFAGAKYDMTAIILRPAGSPQTTTTGEWQYVQDPITGAIERKWVEVDTPAAPGVERLKINCTVRGFPDSGIRILGTSESVDELFRKTDLVKMYFPAKVHLSDNDRVTEVRWRKTGQLIWREEERERMQSGQWVEFPTVFNVKGVIPVITPLVGHMESFAMLERAEVQ
jgi:hypothetical protein